MRLPVHQWADAIRLQQPWRYCSGELSDVSMSDDRPYSPAGPASPASTTRNVCLYSAGRAPRVPLIEMRDSDRRPLKLWQMIPGS